MKKLMKTMFAILILSGMISFSNSSTVKAQVTYDLNGNQIDVITYAGGYEKGTGYRFISSEESGTIAYFDGNGNLIRLVNRATKEVIISNEETTAAPTIQTTTKAPEKITLKKVTGLKKKTVYKKYRVLKKSKEKIRYKYGFKISWKKIKGVTGYEVYRYEAAKKCWTKIRTTKKNSFTLTGLLSGSHVNLKVRAYKKVTSGKEYGKYSKVYKFAVKTTYYKKKLGGDYKNFYDKYASEEAFVIQNKYRKAAGVPELEWNDVLYDAAKERCYDMYKMGKISHEGCLKTITGVFTNKYGADVNSANILPIGENAAGAFHTPKDVMQAWKESPGHYRNLTDRDCNIGAIACHINSDAGRHWIAIFADTGDDGSVHVANNGEYYTVDYSFLY